MAQTWFRGHNWLTNKSETSGYGIICRSDVAWYTPQNISLKGCFLLFSVTLVKLQEVYLWSCQRREQTKIKRSTNVTISSDTYVLDGQLTYVRGFGLTVRLRTVTILTLTSQCCSLGMTGKTSNINMHLMVEKFTAIKLMPLIVGQRRATKNDEFIIIMSNNNNSNQSAYFILHIFHRSTFHQLRDIEAVPRCGTFQFIRFA